MRCPYCKAKNVGFEWIGNSKVKARCPDCHKEGATIDISREMDVSTLFEEGIKLQIGAAFKAHFSFMNDEWMDEIIEKGNK